MLPDPNRRARTRQGSGSPPQRGTIYYSIQGDDEPFITFSSAANAFHGRVNRTMHHAPKGTTIQEQSDGSFIFRSSPGTELNRAQLYHRFNAYTSSHLVPQFIIREAK